MRIESLPQFLEAKQPHVEDGRLIIDHAPEVTWRWAKEYWGLMNGTMEQEGIDRSKCQLVVLPSRGDLTIPLYSSLKQNPIGHFPVATVLSEEYSDHELGNFLENEAVDAEHVYIIGSLLTERDFARARAVADHYKHVLNAKCVTLVCSFLGRGRQDKNVDVRGEYVSCTINIHSEIGGLSPFIDRMIVLEPHSSATQAYAAEFGMALIPLSPWEFILNRLNDFKEITPENTVIARPDWGRNLAAIRAQERFKIDSVSFKKTRVSEDQVYTFGLTLKEQELVKGRTILVYDDEAATVKTMHNIAIALEGYGAKELIACLVHCKFTGGWRKRIKHNLFSLILGTDSLAPVGIIETVGEIERISLVPLLIEIIKADIEGVNFWTDERFRSMILQEYPAE